MICLEGQKPKMLHYTSHITSLLSWLGRIGSDTQSILSYNDLRYLDINKQDWDSVILFPIANCQQ